MTGFYRFAKSRAKRSVSFPKTTNLGMAQADKLTGTFSSSEVGGRSLMSTVPLQSQDEVVQPSAEVVTLIPAMHLGLPFVLDDFETDTSRKQLSTARNILRFLNESPLPNLDKIAHAQFLLDPLQNGLPRAFTGLDASRPWVFYWCINGLAILGEDVGIFIDQVISSFKPLQYKTGGFGGGDGQRPHMAAAYAVVLTLAITSYHASKDLPEDKRIPIYAKSFSWINRRALLQWIRRTKLPSGGFRVNEEGEEDVRAGYCALVIMALLGYDEDELRGDASLGEAPLLDGVLEYFQSCQTWEGGLGAKQHSEAHGGYAFCVLAALCLLGDPKSILRSHLDLESFVSWLSARQYAPEGGFSGRTNKLVDGCYSTWVGGCWSLVEAAVNGVNRTDSASTVEYGSLWSRKALIRYILTCCQGPHGGLRDKPGLRPDFYHTNYVLIGLSAAQHYYFYDRNAKPIFISPFKHGYLWRGSRNIPKAKMREGQGGGWEAGVLEDEEDRIGMQHPIFNIPLGAELPLQQWWKLFKDALS